MTWGEYVATANDVQHTYAYHPLIVSGFSPANLKEPWEIVIHADGRLEIPEGMTAAEAVWLTAYVCGPSRRLQPLNIDAWSDAIKKKWILEDQE